jgi:double-stranded uracil-DNA glycosylase
VSTSVERLRTIPDTVGPGMSLLVCGLNPSLHAADRGVGYAGPGNRFWPAAVAAGLITEPFQPVRALTDHRIGMTDLVKRATPRAAQVTSDEFRGGLERVEWLVRWLQPRVVCLVGLEGWRRALDRAARPGPQVATLGGRPVHLMPSTSGLNTHIGFDGLVEHLRVAASTATSAAGNRSGESIPSEP